MTHSTISPLDLPPLHLLFVLSLLFPRPRPSRRLPHDFWHHPAMMLEVGPGQLSGVNSAPFSDEADIGSPVAAIPLSAKGRDFSGSGALMA